MYEFSGKVYIFLAALGIFAGWGLAHIQSKPSYEQYYPECRYADEVRRANAYTIDDIVYNVGPCKVTVTEYGFPLVRKKEKYIIEASLETKAAVDSPIVVTNGSRGDRLATYLVLTPILLILSAGFITETLSRRQAQKTLDAYANKKY